MVGALVSGSSGPGSSPVLCSWTRHFTLTVPPSTQEYKWVPANCWGNLTNCWGVTCDGLASRPEGVEILLAASCYGNQDKLWPDEPVLAPKASLQCRHSIHRHSYTSSEVLNKQNSHKTFVKCVIARPADLRLLAGISKQKIQSCTQVIPRSASFCT